MTPARYRRLHRLVLLVPFAIALLLMCGTIPWSRLFSRAARVPPGVRIFQENRHVFEAYAAGDGSQTTRDELTRVGVRYYSRVDGNAKFTFPFMAVESVPTILHTPRGRDGLPEGFWTGGRPGSQYFAPQQLDEHWFYYRWDQ
jgi:hypothetical protein